MELNKLESIFKDIWEHDSLHKQRELPYQGNLQKWAFWLMLFFFVSALLVALSTFVKGPFSWQKSLAIIFIALAQLAALFYQLAFIFQGIKIFKEPTKHLLQPGVVVI
jgi:hypothetical protein